MPSKPKGSAAPARWALQDAKNKLSAVLVAAARGQPQVVTRLGVEAAVGASYAEYARIATALFAPCHSVQDYVPAALSLTRRCVCLR